MSENNKHDLFWELEAFNPRWQTCYRTVLEAAKAAQVIEMYTDWLFTPTGKRYQELHNDVPDTLERVRLEQEAMQRLPFTITSLQPKCNDY